jgi:sialidase-1
MKIRILICVALFLIPYIVDAEVDEALVVYLPFDDGAGNAAKDVTVNGNDGKFVGNIKWVAGKFDGGIELDGQSYVDIPWADSIDVDDQSFSTEIWFKYDEKASAGSLIWGYAVGGGNPQFWIRSEPGDNRIRGLIHDGTSIIIQTKEPHNDGQWHHLAFVRDSKGEDTLTVYIDGSVEDSQKGKIASVTKGQAFGIHLGQRVDGQNKYKGVLDEFRLWTRALSQDEIKKIMTQGQAAILPVHPSGRLTTTWGTLKNQ